MSLVFLAGLTPAGYAFLGVPLLSCLIAFLWFRSPDRKEKGGCTSIGIMAFFLSIVFVFPVVYSVEIFEGGNQIARIGLAAFWIVVAVFLGFIVFSKNKAQISKIITMIFANCFMSIALGLFLVMFGGLTYFLYQRFFTTERDDAPVWATMVCIFFVGVLIISFIGFFIKDEKGSKKEKTFFVDLKKASLKPNSVIELDLSDTKLDVFPMEILQFRNIKFLILSNTNISEIPSDINKLKKLIGLDISKNPISATEITKIKALLSKDVELVY